MFHRCFHGTLRGKRSVCQQNNVWHSYQSLSMQIHVPTVSRREVNFLLLRPAALANPSHFKSMQEKRIKTSYGAENF